MRKFVMVGGVDPITNLDSIDEEIIKLTDKTSPKILFIPIASGDDENYCNLYRKIYEERLGCTLEVLYLFKELPCEDEIRSKVFSSDIVYIGGGPTLRLIEYLNKFNMKNILAEASEKGIVIAAISEGGIVLGEHYFYSEEKNDYNEEDFNNFRKVDCFGFLNLLICPHYNLEGYSHRIASMVREYELVGIGLDNNAALEIIDDKYRIISSKYSANAYALYLKQGKLYRKLIEKKSEFRDLAELVGLNEA